jgi:starvation-inducible outer membrane lipoprotein
MRRVLLHLYFTMCMALMLTACVTSPIAGRDEPTRRAKSMGADTLG